MHAAISDWLCTLQTDKDKLNDSYAALERKAALYDKLSQGRFDDDEEQYNVDFLQKGFLTDEMRHSRHRPAHDPAEPIDTSAMAIRASGVQLKPILADLLSAVKCFEQKSYQFANFQKGKPASYQISYAASNCAAHASMHSSYKVTAGDSINVFQSMDCYAEY